MNSETETKIFLAALVEFAERGRDGARMQAIADRAGINKALVHYYFRSKEKLYEAVFAHMLGKYFGVIGGAMVEAEDFAGTLRVFIDRFLTVLSEHPELPRFILRELTGNAGVFTTQIRALISSQNISPPVAFLQQFRRAVQRGEIRAADPVQTLLSLIGACVYFFAAQPIVAVFIPDMEGRRAELIEARKEHLFDLFYYGLRPTPPFVTSP
jgi:TetR/AcrR family transcriptional regulator